MKRAMFRNFSTVLTIAATLLLTALCGGCASTEDEPSLPRYCTTTIEAVVFEAVAPDALVRFAGDDTPLCFKVHTDVYGRNRIDYRCLDYDDREVLTGTAEIKDGQMILPSPVRCGFYEFVFDGVKQRVGVLVLPPPEEGRAPDTFFAMDAAFSFFEPFVDVQLTEAYIRILEKCGIGAVRERFSWERANPRKDEYNFSQGVRALELRRRLKAHGMDVLDCFHDAPGWVKACPDRNASGYSPYPENLIETADSWAVMAEAYGDCIDWFESWNEPDISFGQYLPGDRSCALRRVLAYVFAREGLRTGMVSGVFACSMPTPGLMRGYIGNGILDEAGVMSYHDYGAPDDFAERVQMFRDCFAGHENFDIPLWITESGTPWSRGGARADAAADRASAIGITGKALEAKACGIERFYAFIMAYYDESVRNFGMIDGHHTPMRCFAGYAAASRILSHHEYIGDLKGASGAKLARVFADGDRAVAVIYTAGAPEVEVILPEGFVYDRRLGIDGRELPVAGSWSGRDGIWYLTGARKDFEPFLERETPAMKLLEIARGRQTRPTPVYPVVFQYVDDPDNTFWFQNGYLFVDPSKVNFSFWVNNLGDQELTISPEAVLPAGTKVLSALPDKLVVPPHDRVMAAMELDLIGAFESQPETEVVVRDRSGKSAGICLPVNFWKWDDEAVAAPGILPIDDVEELSTAMEQGGTVIPAESWFNKESQEPCAIAAEFKVFYDPETLQFVVKVDDANGFFQPFQTREMWRGDSVQVGFQFERGARFSEIAASEADGQPRVYLHFTENPAQVRDTCALRKSRVKVHRLSPNKLIYVIELDRAELGMPELRPGRNISLGVLVNSSSGKVRDGYCYWGNGIGEVKNPGEYNLLKLGE